MSRKSFTTIIYFFVYLLTQLLPSVGLAQSNEEPGNSDYTNTHIFSDYGNIQSSQQQLILLNDKAPLPFSIFSSIQKWTTGPAQNNLITQMAQGLYKVDDELKIVASELYQRQGGINLTNTTLGVNYQPTKDWSINASAGAGTGDLYTYKYSLQLSPEYKLPLLEDNRKPFSTSVGLNYQAFALGEFKQIIPKLNWQASEYLPPLSLGYAFGSFLNLSSITSNQYYQPKTINGAMVSTSLRTTDRSFLIISYYPYNKNLIAGYTTIQDTIGATFNYKITDQVHISAFSQYQNTRGNSIDLAFGGSLNFAF